MMFGFSYAQEGYLSATYKGKIGKYAIVMELFQGDGYYGDYFICQKIKKLHLVQMKASITKGK